VNGFTTRVLVGLAGVAVLVGAGAALMARPHPLRADVASPAAPAPLAGRVLHTSPVLALPTRLAVVGEHLVVVDAASDSALHVLDRRSGRLLRSLGRRGKGPGEFQGAWSLAPDRAWPDAVWVYDLPLRRLTRVPLAREADVRASARRMVRLAGGAVLTNPTWLGADTILSPGFLLDARVALFDGAGRRIGQLGDPPLSPESGQPMQATQALVALHPDGRRIAIANRYVGRIELLDLPDGTVHTIDAPVEVNAGHAPIALDRFAYLDVAGTTDRVIALFSGRTRDEYDGRAVFGDRLHVFDWEGRFQSEVRLDADALAIAVAEREGVVYALRHEPEPAVVRYRLPSKRR
jgi:hypothetical protein